MTEGLWGTGKCVVLDSGFCVLEGLVELKKLGVFAAAVIKKRRYYPKFIKGDDINGHFKDVDVGTADSISGTLRGISFNVMGLKEPPYVMMMMTTYGTLERSGRMTERSIGPIGNRTKVKFKYPEVFGNHFKYRHMVDDHNNRRHSPISFEESWATKNWTHRVFSFIIAITEVNTNLAMKTYYGASNTCQITFRKELSRELIHNKYISTPAIEEIRRGRRRAAVVRHCLITLETGKKFKNGRIVAAGMNYQQYKCAGCRKRTRKYCACFPGNFLCQECYANHRNDEDMNG